MLALRPYQREAIDSLYSWFNDNDGNPLVVIPTAGGKSLVIATFVREALEAWPDTRVVILAHVKELLAQNYAELIGAWLDAPAGIYSAGLGKRDLNARILIAGIQSVHSKAYQLQRVDLVLVDEAHLIPRSANTLYGRFLNDLRQINPYLKIVGFTATPFRLDSGLLHKGKDALFSDIAYDANIRDLIDAGFLSPPVTQRALAQIDTSHVGTRGGEFIAGQLEAAALDPETVAGIAREIVAAGADRKGWLVFGCGVEHCNMLREALRGHGVTCEAIFGETHHADRDRIIRDFKAQRIRALVSVAVLTTGFNAKHVDLIALARPTKSTGLFIQMVGRGTRLFPGKANCLVLDFGGNIERHGPIDQPRVKAQSEGGGSAPFKVCPECGAEVPTALRECNCGFIFPPPQSEVDTVASAAAILSSQIQPEWVDVSDVSYRRHEKPGKPASLCCTYRCGMAWHREWICLSHTGYARSKAVSWWQKRLPSAPVPNSTDEAMEHVSALPKPSKILIRQNGKFVEIIGVSW